ncbi:MAG: cadherin-like beta sandwich domain-containing protein, partial [Gammaproteobacteria bacterium]|nr:cadherin-like beta sandwich domain-containing protein [Gammaproteobacteria bacterium]
MEKTINKNFFRNLRAILNSSFVLLLLAGCGMDGEAFTAQDLPLLSESVAVAELEDIQLSSGSIEPKFDPHLTSYISTQPNHIEKITITPVLEDGSIYELFVNGQPVTSSDTSAETGEEASQP